MTNMNRDGRDENRAATVETSMKNAYDSSIEDGYQGGWDGEPFKSIHWISDDLSKVDRSPIAEHVKEENSRILIPRSVIGASGEANGHVGSHRNLEDLNFGENNHGHDEDEAHKCADAQLNQHSFARSKLEGLHRKAECKESIQRQQRKNGYGENLVHRFHKPVQKTKKVPKYPCLQYEIGDCERSCEQKHLICHTESDDEEEYVILLLR